MEKITGRPPGREEGLPLPPLLRAQRSSWAAEGLSTASHRPKAAAMRVQEVFAGPAALHRAQPGWDSGRGLAGPVSIEATIKHTSQSSHPRVVSAVSNLGWVLSHSDPWTLAEMRLCCSSPAFERPGGMKHSLLGHPSHPAGETTREQRGPVEKMGPGSRRGREAPSWPHLQMAPALVTSN